MGADAGDKTLHLKRFPATALFGFRFHKNRESVNMAYLKGTARPKHCVTFLRANFMCKKHRNNRMMYVEKFSHGI